MTNPRIDADGNKLWYNNQGQRHREDGPAWEDVNGDKAWFINDELHREDGPAVTSSGRSKDNLFQIFSGRTLHELESNKSWFIHGKQII